MFFVQMLSVFTFINRNGANLGRLGHFYQVVRFSVALFPEFTPKAWDSPYSDFCQDLWKHVYSHHQRENRNHTTGVCVWGGRYLATV